MDKLEDMLRAGKPSVAIDHWIGQYQNLMRIRVHLHDLEKMEYTEENQILVDMERLKLRLAEKTLARIENLAL